MPIPMRFESTLASFSQSLSVEDYSCGYTDGIWGETLIETRAISGIVLALKTEDLQLYNSGNNVRAGISITTKDVLYFPVTDVEVPPEEGEEEVIIKQSYVTYLGIRFKVSGSGLYSTNTAYNLYHAVRFLE